MHGLQQLVGVVGEKNRSDVKGFVVREIVAEAESERRPAAESQQEMEASHQKS